MTTGKNILEFNQYQYLEVNCPSTQTDNKPKQLAQDEAGETEKPPGENRLPLIPKPTTVSWEDQNQKEAFLIGRSPASQTGQLVIKTFTDLPSCRALFNKFSPEDTVFADWSFRYAWYLGYRCPPLFLTVGFKDQPLGLLPLWYEKSKNQFRWFGSWWMEENSFWVFDKKLIPLLLAACPSKTYLNAISLNPASLNQILKLEPDDPKFILDLTSLCSVNQFLAKLKKKPRYNLKRDARIIEAQQPEIIINRFTDLEALFQLSIQRFKSKGDQSDFTDQQRQATFREIINQAKTYQPRLITIEINGQIAGIDLVLIYKKGYYALKCAYNVQAFPGIGSFANLYQIQEAINLGCNKIDFLEVSYGWKEKLFNPLPLYSFRKGLTQEETAG